MERNEIFDRQQEIARIGRAKRVKRAREIVGAARELCRDVRGWQQINANDIETINLAIELSLLRRDVGAASEHMNEFLRATV